MADKPLIPPLMRPQMHHAPIGAWMNDPVGLVRQNGVWRLFYQRAEDPEQVDMAWGLAESEDLLHWTPRPTALAPDARGRIYSGSTVLRGGALWAFYTRHEPSAPRQTQELAISEDGGRSWTPFASNPLIDENRRDSRDPFVFRWGQGWRMLLAEPVAWSTPLQGRSRLALHASDDLIDWTPLGAFGPAADAEVMFECPMLTQLRDPSGRSTWLLMVSTVNRAENGARCGVIGWLGDFDGQTFDVAHGPLTIDHGPDFYAAAPFAGLEAHEAPVVTAWLNSWAYARRLPGADWSGGAHALARRLSWIEEATGARIIQTPAAWPSLARSQAWSGEVKGPVPLGRLAPLATITVKATLEPDRALRVGLQLGGGESVELWVTGQGVTLTRDGPGAREVGGGFAGAWSTSPRRSHADIALRLLIDGCVLEVFDDVTGATLSALLLRDGDAHLSLNGSALDCLCQIAGASG